MLEVAGLQTALQSVCCSECGSGPIEFREDSSKKQGLYTAPSLSLLIAPFQHLFPSPLSVPAKLYKSTANQFLPTSVLRGTLQVCKSFLQ